MSKYWRYKLILRDIIPPPRVFSLLAGLMLATQAISLLIPYIAGQFSARLLGAHASLAYSSQVLLLLWFLLLLVQTILSVFSSYLTERTGEKMLFSLRTKLYNHLQALPLNYFHERKHGRILALVTNDTEIISSFVTSTLVSIGPLLITATGALVCIFLISPLIAMLAGTLIPFFYLVIKILGRKIRPISQAMIREYGNTLTVVEENLAIISVIKSFVREQREAERFQRHHQNLFELTTAYLRSQSLLSPAISFLGTSIVLLMLLLVGESIRSGSLGTADIVSLILYGMLLTRPIGSLANIYGQVMRTLGAAEHLDEVFNYKAESYDSGFPLPKVTGDIRFSGVFFAYPGRSPILQGLNLHIRPTETVAITGINGSGKSTIVSLLLRFYSASRGMITIDGHDISTLSLTSLRSNIGVVQQQVLLQNSSVADNILFGKPEATMDEVKAAAQSAHALGFIEALPDGFDTLIGDQGVRLSGGQKQRLALARALLKNPAILILDEATAMFDPAGEEQFITECHSLLADKTVLIITHRPGSLVLADRIVTLENGMVSGVTDSKLN